MIRKDMTVKTKIGPDHDLCHVLVHRCLTSTETRNHLAQPPAESITKLEEKFGIKEAVIIANADTTPHLTHHILRLKK